MILRSSLLTALVLPVALAAQSPAGSLGWWTTTGGRDGNAAAHGLRLAGSLGTHLAGRELRLEGAFSQTIFRRAFVGGESRVNENSIEIAPLLRLRRGVVVWWPFAGPVVSVGLGCGTDGSNDPNGLVACSNNGARSEGSVRLGAVAGLATSRSMGSALLIAELRLQANTIATARGSGAAVVMAIGIQLP